MEDITDATYTHSNDDTNFQHKLLTDTQVSRLRKALANVPSTSIKLSYAQLSKFV